MNNFKNKETSFKQLETNNRFLLKKLLKIETKCLKKCLKLLWIVFILRKLYLVTFVKTYPENFLKINKYFSVIHM